MDMFEFLTLRIRNGEIRMMKFLYGKFRILKDDVLVFCGGGKEVFAFDRKLI